MTHHGWIVSPLCHEVAAGSQGGTARAAEAVLWRVVVPASWAWSRLCHGLLVLLSRPIFFPLYTSLRPHPPSPSTSGPAKLSWDLESQHNIFAVYVMRT